MSRTDPEKGEQETLLLKLNTRSLTTSPPQLRQPLAYVLHLRSYWKPEGQAKLVVPASWMGFLAFADGKSGVKCAAVDRCCPFRSVRFENVAKTYRAASDDELELPRDVVSQVLTSGGRDEDCLSMFLFRAFEGIPRTRLHSDASEKRVSSTTSTSASRCTNFALIPRHASNDIDTAFPENDTPCLLLGMTAHPHTQDHDPHSTSYDTLPGPFPLASIPEELTRHGQHHLTRLASLMHREGTTDAFPEWLILFGLVFDAHRICIVVYVPYRRHLDAIDCAAYVVDELAIHAPVTNAGACEPILERLRLLSALTTLRRHVRHLSKYLLTTCEGGIERTGSLGSYDLDDSGPLDRCSTASLGSSQNDGSSVYSTCPSNVHPCASNDDHIDESERELCSTCRSASSCCSACSSLLESDSIYYSEDTSYASSDYMDPSTSSVSQGEDDAITSPRKLTESKRREIIAWTLTVVPSKHPVMDTYRLVVYDSSPGQQKDMHSKASTRR